MGDRLALDSNLILLLAVGRAEQGLIAKHKRLRQFDEADYELLLGYLVNAAEVVTTPNAMTEVSNLATFGMLEPARSRIVASLKTLITSFSETYAQSRLVSELDDFVRLGLTDCAWFPVLENGARLLTVDNDLYLVALQRGYSAVNFEHIRRAMRHD